MEGQNGQFASTSTYHATREMIVIFLPPNVLPPYGIYEFEIEWLSNAEDMWLSCDTVKANKGKCMDPVPEGIEKIDKNVLDEFVRISEKLWVSRLLHTHSAIVDVRG
jgi:hypothetical protein